jgi:hypothetical protein
MRWSGLSLSNGADLVPSRWSAGRALRLSLGTGASCWFGSVILSRGRGNGMTTRVPAITGNQISQRSEDTYLNWAITNRCGRQISGPAEFR